MLIFATVIEMGTRILFFVGLVVASFAANAQEQTYIIKDLKGDWKIFREGKFRTIGPTEDFKAIHLQLSPAQQQTYFLLRAKKTISLFVNGIWLQNIHGNKAKFSIDSLSKFYGRQLLFSVYSSQSIANTDLDTQLAANNPTSIDTSKIELFSRINDGSTDFFILAAMILLFAFAFLFRASPRLMLDYLNPIKAVSLREREGVLTSNRITSSVNILFYIFTSYLISFLCFVWLRSVKFFPLINLSTQTFGEAFWKWNVMAVFIFFLFVIKFVLISFFSFLFRLKGSLHLHFYNFIRILLLLSCLLLILALVVFIIHTPLPQYLKVCSIIVTVFTLSWLVVAYLKLLTNSTFSFLHLFFYLCTTEIIPLIILIKFIS